MSNQPDQKRHAAARLLPTSLDELLAAVEVLEDALYLNGFPNLVSTPSTSEEVEHLVLAAAEWAKVVRRAYGAAERRRMYRGQGILPFFEGGSGFDAHVDAPDFLLGELPDEFSVKERFARELYFFDYIFSKASELYLGSGRSLRDPGERGVDFTPANWAEIRDRLLLGYGMTVKKARGLANWVRARIQELEFALLPRVRKLGEGAHNRVRIEIEHAAGRREVELTHMQAEFLRELGATGRATTSRRTKMEVLQAVPELRPWIENRPRGADADDANGATYGVNRDVQAAISLD